MRADKKQIARLVNTAKGQLEGVIAMIGEDRYCVDVSNQILAAQAILTRANREILKAHIDGCVKEAFDSGSEEIYEEKMQEVLSLIDRMNR